MEIARTGELFEIQVQDLCWLVEIVRTGELVERWDTALFAGRTVRVSEGPTHATVRMTTRSGKDNKPRDVMSEGEANERSEGGTEMSETTTALLQLLREQQRALTEQQQQAREQQMQAQEQQAAQQALLLRVVEQQKEEMARYREEMSHLLRKEESPAKSKLPKPTLQKLGPNDDIEHFLATFERIAKQHEWPVSQEIRSGPITIRADRIC